MDTITARPLRTTSHHAGESHSMGLVGVAAMATAAGLALGYWCRAAVDSGTGPGGRIMAGLGELGSPWILSAAIVGAIGALISRQTTKVAVVASGAIAGMGALVVATLVYYNGIGALLAPTDVIAVRGYVQAWLVVAALVGAGFGALGAIWVNDRSGSGSRWAAVALATVVAGEALFVLRSGWANGDPLTVNLHRGVLVAALAIGAAIAPAGSRVSTVAAAFVLLWPAAAFIAHVYAYIYIY